MDWIYEWKRYIRYEYTSRFLKGGVNVFDESVNWFVENGAITAEDKIEIIKLKSHRNEIAHDMMEFLAEPDKEIKDNLLISCYKILSKIDKWWILQVETDNNSSRYYQIIMPAGRKGGPK